MSSISTEAVLFDLGGVIADWDPRYYYQDVFSDHDEMEWFLQNVCTMDWHNKQDRGRPMAENARDLIEQHPKYRTEIEAWETEWPLMFRGAVSGVVELIEQLAASDVPLFMLTNLPAEKIDHVLETYPCAALFSDIVVSGQEKMAKPDPEIFHMTAERVGFSPNKILFIDDVEKNLDAAVRLGFHGHLFRGAETLELCLKEHQFL